MSVGIESLSPVPAVDAEWDEAVWLDAAYNFSHAEPGTTERTQYLREYVLAVAVQLELDGIHFTPSDAEAFNTTFNQGVLRMCEPQDYHAIALTVASAKSWRRVFKVAIFSSINLHQNQESPQNLRCLLAGLRVGQYRFTDL